MYLLNYDDDDDVITRVFNHDANLWQLTYMMLLVLFIQQA